MYTHYNIKRVIFITNTIIPWLYCIQPFVMNKNRFSTYILTDPSNFITSHFFFRVYHILFLIQKNKLKKITHFVTIIQNMFYYKNIPNLRYVLPDGKLVSASLWTLATPGIWSAVADPTPDLSQEFWLTNSPHEHSVPWEQYYLVVTFANAYFGD